MKTTHFLLVLLTASQQAWPQAARLYASIPSTETLLAYEIPSGELAWKSTAGDRSGSIGLAVTPDGKTVAVVEDGPRDSRIRLLDASGKEQATADFNSRARSTSGNSAFIAPGGVLLVPTTEIASWARGVRTYSLGSRRFATVGLRDRTCAAPLFAAIGETLFGACETGIQAFRAEHGEFAKQRETVAALVGLRAVLPRSADMVDLLIQVPGEPARLMRWTANSLAAVRSFTMTAATDSPAEGIVSDDGKVIVVVNNGVAYVQAGADSQAVRVRLAVNAQAVGFMPKTSTWYALDGASGLVQMVAADGKITSIRLKGWRGESRPVTALVATRP